MLKRVLCILFAACLVLAAVSCSEQTVSEEFFDDEFAEADDGTMKFNGEEFIFALADAYVENFKPEISTTENDAKLKKIKDTETKLNCKITFSGRDWSYESTLFAEYCATGSTGADFTYSRTEMINPLIDAGVVVDLASLSSLDITDNEKWGSDQRLQMLKRGDAIYGVQSVGSMYWPQMPIYDGAFLTNNENLYKTGGTNPAELIESGNWTFDYFLKNLESYGTEEISALCILSDGRPYLELSAIFANGADIVHVDGNGKYQFGLKSTAAQNALEFAAAIRANKAAVETIDAQSTYFSHGGGTFMLTSSWRGLSTVNDYEIMNNLENVSWWPFPYGPDAEYGKSYAGHFGSALPLTAIYSNGRDEEAGYVLNELFSPLEEYGKTGYYDFLSTNYFHNEESYNVYMNALNESHYLYDIQLGDTYSKISSALSTVGNGLKTYAAAIEEIETAVQTKLDELNAG